MRRVIFLSAVSREFHSAPPELRYRFLSYRDVLSQAFRTLAPQYEVIVQDNLVQGVGDLLETLDREVARSLVVIHLIGDMAGEEPGSACVRNLHARHPDFLAAQPELKAALEGRSATYTQWEVYLAFHHGVHRLIFEALPEAPRSPSYEMTAADQLSQHSHRHRISVTGAHRGYFSDQGDAARKTIRSFLHRSLDHSVDTREPAEGALAAAWSAQETIVHELADAIRKPDPRTVPVHDPANVAVFVAAVRLCAGRWNLNLATVLDIAAHHEQAVRAAAESRPTPEALYEQAFAELALGELTAARRTAERASAMALQFRLEKPESDNVYRDITLNALLLAHDASRLAHHTSQALAYLQEAAALLNKQSDPLLWAGVNQQLAEFLIDQAQYGDASRLVSEVLAVREQLEGKSHHSVAAVLLLLARVLFAQGDFFGSESAAARAEEVYAAQEPPKLAGIAAALSHRFVALDQESRFNEAESLAKRSLVFTEQAFGPGHPDVATSLTHVAVALQRMGKSDEAEILLRRALGIIEKEYGKEDSRAAPILNNLAQVLQASGDTNEAETLMRRGLIILQENYGQGHPDFAGLLQNLAGMPLIAGAKYRQNTSRLAVSSDGQASCESPSAGVTVRRSPPTDPADFSV